MLGALVGTGVLAVGLATVAAQPTTTNVRSVPQPPKLVDISNDAVACGSGPVPEVNLALFLGQQRLSASSNASDGQFALIVPQNTSGTVHVQIEAAPAGYAVLRRRGQLGSLDIPADERQPPSAPQVGPAQPLAPGKVLLSTDH